MSQQIVAQHASQEKPKYEKKIYELSQEDLLILSEEEKKILVAQIGEEINIFQQFDGQYGPYEKCPELEMMQKVPGFYQIMVAAEDKGNTHVAFGGYKYVRKYGGVTRSINKPYIPKTSNNSTGWKSYPKKTKYLTEMFVGTIDEINQLLQDESKNWESEPKELKDGRFMITRYRY